MKSRRLAVALLLVAHLTSRAAHAEAPREDPFAALMGAIDTLPRDAAELNAWLPGARTRLARAAADRSVTPWIRIRSLQLLLRFADAVPDVLALVADGDTEVRAAAIYALARVYSEAGPAHRPTIARAAAQGILDPEREVRATSTRALRWLVAAPAR